MNDKQTQLQSILQLLGSSVTKSELNKSFADLLRFVKALKDSNDQQISLIKSAVSMMGAQLKQEVQDDLAEATKDNLDKVNKALKEQENGMKFLYDKVAQIEKMEGPAGDDGHTPTKEELIALITPLIPQVEAQEPIDEEALTARVLEKVPKAGRVGWGAHPLRLIDSSGNYVDNTTRNIKFSGATLSRSADGIVTVSIGGGTAVYNEVVSGSGTTFTLAHTPTAGTLRVYARGQRIFPTTNYTLSTATITTLDTWSASDIVADYSF